MKICVKCWKTMLCFKVLFLLVMLADFLRPSLTLREVTGYVSKWNASLLQGMSDYTNSAWKGGA